MNLELIYILAFIISLIASLLITPLVAKYMKKIGKVGKDVHKVDLPETPESVGLGYVIIFTLTLLGGILITNDELTRQRLTIMVVVMVLVIAIGLYDDFKTLSAILKPGLLILVSLPIVIFQVADPRPVIPFVGPVRLTLVYWGLAALVVAITSNASNMIDVLNGTMSGSGILIAFTAFAASFIVPLSSSQQFIARYSSLALAGALLGFFWYNRYPAKVFAGDTGSLGTGAAIGLIAIYGKLEFVLIVALLVHIMNSFSILSSIGGLKERREIQSRPVKVENGIIYPSLDKKAPITLVRLIVSKRPKTEKEVVNAILFLVLYSCILALFSAYLILEVSF